MVDLFTPPLAGERLAEALRLIGELDEFKGRWRKLQEIRAEQLAQLRHVTTIESAASSTRIEGAELSDEEVARVLQGMRIEAFRSRDESEVRGYGDVLQTVFDSHRHIPFDENHIKQLHKILLGHSVKDERHRGAYKTHENHVQARHADGRVEVIFRTASPFETPLLMERLLEETHAGFEARGAHPLLVIARFVVVFLAIHPFQDGNGRLSRALTTLLLLQQGYDYVPYASLERVVEENKHAYYAALRQSQTALREHPSEFGDWLMFLLRALQAQKRNLEAKLDVERSLLQISDVQRRILDVVGSQGRTTTAALSRTLGIAARTVRYHLDVLVAQRLIVAHGERRGRYYTRGALVTSPLATLASPNGKLLAEILAQGGRIARAELLTLVQRHGFDHGIVAALHGRKLGHLRRVPGTAESVLTSRGQEAAQQFRFASSPASNALNV